MHLHILPTTAALSASIAAYIAAQSAQAIAARGRFTVAVSGGSMPALLAAGLLAEPWPRQINWPTWRLFFADERCMPLTDPASNYYLAQTELLRHLNIPPQQIYTIEPSLAPEQTAIAYQDTLRQVFKPAPGQLPRFDLILLGLGEDGHTASLFPGHPLLGETRRWVAPIIDSPKPPPARITLTLPVINQARQVAFMSAGAGKAEILPQVLAPLPSTPALPARLVRPVEGDLHWFVDEAAAAGLPHRSRLKT